MYTFPKKHTYVWMSVNVCLQMCLYILCMCVHIIIIRRMREEVL